MCSGFKKATKLLKQVTLHLARVAFVDVRFFNLYVVVAEPSDVSVVYRRGRARDASLFL